MMWLLCILFSCMVLFLEAYGIILCSQMCYNDKTKLKTFYIISFQGKKKNANQTVAIKKFMGVTEEYQKREADTLSLACKTNHPNIVKFIGFDKGTLAIEFCGGGSLDTHIGVNGLPPSEFERFFNQFINGLEHLNKLRIAYRDLKPENILVVGLGTNQTFKISDFGAARVFKKNERYTSLHGTLEYLHPDPVGHFIFYSDEHELPERKFTAEHEVWAMAVTIYHAATGKLPFEPLLGRDNTKLLYDMLMRKKDHHISATETKRGDLVFHSSLPESCALADSVKTNLEALLVGMLRVSKTLQHRASHLEKRNAWSVMSQKQN